MQLELSSTGTYHHHTQKWVKKCCRVIENTLFSSGQLPLTARIDCSGKNVRPATESEQLRIETNIEQ